MQRVVCLMSLAAALAGCAAQNVTGPERWTVLYYDRNHDGVADYELHSQGPNVADADWALVDTKFRGRYDLRIHWGYAIEKQHVDLPIPKAVQITSGKPPDWHTRMIVRTT